MNRPVSSRRSGNRVRREEPTPLDTSKPVRENLAEIFFSLARLSEAEKHKKIFYLNSLKLFKDSIAKGDENILGVSLRDFFLCYRVSLVDECVEVRVASLKVLRFLFNLLGKRVTSIFNDLGFPILICRCIDVNVNNKTERVHALKIIRLWIFIDASSVPLSLIRPLIAIAQDEDKKRDFLLKAVIATLCELTLLKSSFCSFPGLVPALVKHVFEYSQPYISEAIIMSLMFSVNNPSTRANIEPHLEILIAPVTDKEFKLTGGEGDGGNAAGSLTTSERDRCLQACRCALVAVIHSWPGLVWLYQSTSGTLQFLIESLRLPFEDSRKTLIKLFADIFSIQLPDNTNDFKEALKSLEASQTQESWMLYDMFIVAEANDLIPNISKIRMNMSLNYLAFVLLILVQHGLLDAIADVIVQASDELSIQATFLLSSILFKCNKLLPPDCGHSCHTLPSLISAASSRAADSGDPDDTAKRRLRAVSATNRLSKLDVVNKQGVTPFSLFLEQQWEFCGNTSRIGVRTFEDTIETSKIWHATKRSNITDDYMSRMMKDTEVLSKQFSSWKWNLIRTILKLPDEVSRGFKEPFQRQFICRLLAFFKPSYGDFSSIDAKKENTRIIVNVGFDLLDFLLKSNDPKYSELLQEFLLDISTSIRNAPAASSYFGFAKISTQLSQAYFLFIGRLSHSEKGLRLLDRLEIIHQLQDLVKSRSPNDIYAKLIISSMSYTNSGSGHNLLRHCLNSPSETARIYAIEFLRVLLRCRLPDFKRWAMSILVEHINDPSWAVRCSTFSVMIEACEVPENLDMLIGLQPVTTATGDIGVSVRALMAGHPKGFQELVDQSKLDSFVLDWVRKDCLRYVKVAENCLNESLTRHRRLQDGTYGRRSANYKHHVTDAFVPPHLFGSLVQHIEGVRYVQGKMFLSRFIQTIKIRDMSTESLVIQLKAALWSVGHIGSSSYGVPLITEAIEYIADLVESAEVYSVRGTAFFALCLISSSSDGAYALARFNWETVRHTHNDHWPLVFNSASMHSSFFERHLSRAYSNSSSSYGSGPPSITANTESVLYSFTEDYPFAYQASIAEEGSRPRSSSDNATTIPAAVSTSSGEFDKSGCRDRCHSVGASSPEPPDIPGSPSAQHMSASNSIAEQCWLSKARSSSAASTTSGSDIAFRRPRSLGRAQSVPRAASTSAMFLPGSPESATSPTSSYFTSARDALGYATLRAVRTQSRRRVVSVGTDQGQSGRSSNRFYPLGVSLDGFSSRRSGEVEFEDSHALKSLPEELPAEVDFVSYMALCLPADISMLFASRGYEIHRDLSVDDTQPIEPPHKCLCLERYCAPKQQLLIPHFASLAPLKEVEPQRRISRGEPPPKSVAQVRRELICCVTNMCENMGYRKPEMSLLALKSTYPYIFSDLCTYSEVKTQMQSRSVAPIAVGHQHDHSGMMDGLLRAYRSNGIRGLWRGASASVIRVGAGSGFQLATFAKTRSLIVDLPYISEYHIISDLTASSLASIVVSLAMTPFDIVCTRLYNQPTDSNGRGVTYSGFLDCFYKIFTKEGPLAFYKGFTASFLRLGPHTVLTLTFWSQLKEFYENMHRHLPSPSVTREISSDL